MTENANPTPTSPGSIARGLDRAEQIVLGACALSALLCFAPWYAMDLPAELKMLGGQGGSANGFDSWHGIMVFLLCLASGAAVWGEKSGAVQLDRRTARLASVAGCGLAALIALIYIASTDDASMLGLEVGKTLWPYVVLVAMGGAAYFAFTRLGAPAPTGGSPVDPPDRAS